MSTTSPATTDERPPRLTSDAMRSWVSLGAAMVVGVPSLLVLIVFGPLPTELGSSQVFTMSVVLLLYYVFYLGLTWWALIRRDPATLRDLVRTSNRNQRASFERLSGADPISFVLTAVAFALVAVAWTLLDPVTRRDPLALSLSVVMVVLAWVVMQVSATILLLRLDVDRPTFDFPGEGLHGWHDYAYVATQVLTTFATSDVEVRTTPGRRAISVLSIASMVFNTVVIALLVSGFIALTG